MEEEIAESPVLRVFAIRFWIHLEKNTDHADAAFGCSNASLSPDGELLPQTL